MGLKGRVLKNTTYLTVGDKIGYLLQFVFFLYFAKQFGIVPVGEYSFAFFLTYALAVLADSGVSIYLVREVARGSSSDRQLFFDCFVLRASSLFAVFFLASLSIFLFFPALFFLLFNRFFFLLIFTQNLFQHSVFFGHKSHHYH